MSAAQYFSGGSSSYVRLAAPASPPPRELYQGTEEEKGRRNVSNTRAVGTSDQATHAALATGPDYPNTIMNLHYLIHAHVAPEPKRPVAYFMTTMPPASSHPAAAQDVVVQSVQEHLKQEATMGKDFCIANLAHCVFEITRFISVPITLAELAGCTDAHGKAKPVCHPLFAAHMMPTVGDVLTNIDDKHMDPRLIVAGAYSSASTMAQALRDLRPKHILSGPEPTCGGDKDCAVLHAVEVVHCTSTCPLPIGMRVTGVRNLVATDGGCFADVLTGAGAVSDGEDLQMVRHACSVKDYASYVGVDPCKEAAAAAPDEAARNTFTLAQGMSLFLQSQIADTLGEFPDADDTWALHAAYAKEGVNYDASAPHVATASKAGIAYLKQRMEEMQAKMPRIPMKDMKVEFAPARTCTWEAMSADLERMYPDGDVACAPFTVEIGLRCSVSFTNLSYALHDMVCARYAELRSKAKAKDGK